MSDTFDALRERSKTIRARLDRVEWCSISIAVEGVAEQPSRYTAVVRIDGGVAGDLVGGAPRSFRVEPGEHTVVVRLRKRLWLYGCRDQAIVSHSLDLQPGEQANLICGVRPEAREAARRAHAAELDLFQHFCVGSFLALAIGWAAYPVVQRVITVATSRFAFLSFWVPFTMWIVGSRLATAAWTLVLWWLFIGRYSVERRRRLAASLKVEIVEPYFLNRVAEHSDAG
ncbi:MAG: hypothetical protein ACLQIB_23555 [Isosphaeraceae bacterium]